MRACSKKEVDEILIFLSLQGMQKNELGTLAHAEKKGSVQLAQLGSVVLYVDTWLLTWLA